MEGKILAGRYQIVKLLGEGGFGKTYIAIDTHLPNNPECVVKQLNTNKIISETNLQIARRLFNTEAEVLYKLGNHEQIPRLFAHIEENEDFYLVQEFIQGVELSKEIQPGCKLSVQEVICLLKEILEILVFVHQQNVIHRDIKPANLIRRQQDRKLVMIDFGAVKQVNTQFLSLQSQSGVTVAIGSHGYMPPEQLVGNPRFCSDIYAVGIIGLQVLTGLHPTKLPVDSNSSEIAWRGFCTEADSQLYDILDKMIRYDFRQRYQSCTEVISSLNNIYLTKIQISQTSYLKNRIEVIEGDITKQKVQAIVNPTDIQFSGGGGVDYAIHKAAGPRLKEECKRLSFWDRGQAQITSAYNLDSRWIIHTVGPFWQGGNNKEGQILSQCYINCLSLAQEYSIKTIAFPSISTGTFGFSIQLATRIAVREVKTFLEKHRFPEKVIFVCFSKDTYNCYIETLEEIINF
ncbi:hypothetical protein CAL7716_058980 [Calothrix sp. PCC 7716]|nr:hypothetical protein CAL7716_058980 [Calothrix sp. PCC 7716]